LIINCVEKIVDAALRIAAHTGTDVICGKIGALSKILGILALRGEAAKIVEGVK
jgi:hypothetical protein